MRSKLSVAVCIALLGIGYGRVAYAELEDNSASSTALESITVHAQQSATKLLTPLIETPQAVSIITQAQIQQQDANSVQRATAYTPGVFANQVGASNRFDYIVLRGFSDGSLGNTYLNGLKILGDTNSHSSLVIDPWFLDSVEVVRGPASVLYGQSSPGGIVALQARAAEFDSFGSLRLGMGRHNQRYVAFDVNESTDDAQFAWRLTAKARRGHAQVNEVTEERYTLMPSFSWQLSPKTKLELMAYLQREPEGGYHSGLPYEGTVVPHEGKKLSPSFFEGEKEYDKYKRNQILLNYALTHQLNESVTLRQKAQYLRSRVTLNQVYAYGWASPTELRRYYSGSDEKLEAFVIDNQVEFGFSTAGVSHRLLTGLDYQWRNNDVSWPSGGFPTIDAFNPIYGSKPTVMYAATQERHKLKQLGVYVQDLMSWKQWRLTLGGRYDKVDISNLNLVNQNRSALNTNEFSGRAALLYNFESGWAPYVSYSTAFTPTNFVDDSGSLLKPMKGEQWELGVKYQPEGSRNLYTLSIFDITQKNVATKEQPTDPYRAIGKIRSRGVELEANVWMTPQFHLQGNYTYNDIRYVKSDDGNQGNRAVYAPKHMASMWANYNYQGRLQGLSTAVGLRYVRGIQSDRANTHTLPAYTLWDAAVGYDFSTVGIKGLSLSLNAQNLFDKKYVAACNSLEFCYFGAGRNISLNMDYQF